MSKIDITVSVEKEAYEVGVAVVSLINAIRAKKTLPEIAAAEFAHLTAAVQGADQIPAEAKEDAAAFARALANPLSELFTTPAAPPA